MPKFSRLQWIPMIVEAYNEAKLRATLETESGRPPLPASGTRESPGNAAASTRRAAERLRPKRRAHVRKRRARTVPSRRHSASPLRNSHRANVVLSSRTYQAMLRELSETRAKLARLESINDRLCQIQTEMEQRLSDIVAKVQPRPEEQPSRLPPAAGPGYEIATAQPSRLPPATAPGYDVATAQPTHMPPRT
jgi:hypothetical protein